MRTPCERKVLLSFLCRSNKNRSNKQTLLVANADFLVPFIVLPGSIDHQHAKFAARYGILDDSAI